MQTKKQDLTNKIKHFIEEYYGQYGTSPSIRCIAENVGCSKSNVTIYIDYLKEQGLLEIGEGGYRIEEVTKLLQTGKILEEFDRVMFKSLVRKITVLSNKEIEIEFECGITVRETL